MTPTPEFLAAKFYRQRKLAGYSPGGCKESDMNERLSACRQACGHTHTHTHTHQIGWLQQKEGEVGSLLYITTQETGCQGHLSMIWN